MLWAPTPGPRKIFMLSLPLKATDKVELHKCLYRFVEQNYSAEQAEDHRDAFMQATQLRERILGNSQHDIRYAVDAADSDNALPAAKLCVGDVGVLQE